MTHIPIDKLFALLPAPVAFNTKCTFLPLDSPAQVSSCAEAIAIDYGGVLAIEADSVLSGALAGGSALMIYAALPGGILFGPIGLALGAVIGGAVGGVLGRLFPNAFKLLVNPADAARDAIKEGRYAAAVEHLNTMILQVQKPDVMAWVMGKVREFSGAKQKIDTKILASIYKSVVALLQYKLENKEDAVSSLLLAWEDTPYNIVILDLLGMMEYDITPLLLETTDKVSDSIIQTACLERYVRRDPASVWAFYDLSELYRKSSRFTAEAVKIDSLISQYLSSPIWLNDTLQTSKSHSTPAVKSNASRILDEHETEVEGIQKAKESTLSTVQQMEYLKANELALQEEQKKKQAEIKRIQSLVVQTENELKVSQTKTNEAKKSLESAIAEIQRLKEKIRAEEENQRQSKDPDKVQELGEYISLCEAEIKSKTKQQDMLNKTIVQHKEAISKSTATIQTLETGRERLTNENLVLHRRLSEVQENFRNMLRLLFDVMTNLGVAYDKKLFDDVEGLYKGTEHESALKIIDWMSIVRPDNLNEWKKIEKCAISKIYEKRLTSNYRVYIRVNGNALCWMRVTKKEDQIRTIEALCK